MFKSKSKIPYSLLLLALACGQSLLSQISGNITVALTSYCQTTILSEDQGFLFCLHFT